MFDLTHAGRTRSREEEADSSDGSNGSKRQKRSKMERVVSLGTVLRCVDTHTDREGTLDEAVGERPATVHEMTEGQPCSSSCALVNESAFMLSEHFVVLGTVLRCIGTHIWAEKVF